MQIEKIRPTLFRVTLHTYDLVSLIAAARWVVDGARGELSDDARKHLTDVLRRYDAAFESVEQDVAADNEALTMD